MSTAIETLKAKRASAQDDFVALAEAILLDEPVDEGKAERVLHASGRTPEELERLVARLRKIKQLENIIAGRDELHRQRIALDSERAKAIEVERAEREEMQKRHTQAESEYGSRALKIQLQHRRIRDAQQELHSLLNSLQEPSESAASFTPGDLSTERQVGPAISGGRMA